MAKPKHHLDLVARLSASPFNRVVNLSSVFVFLLRDLRFGRDGSVLITRRDHFFGVGVQAVGHLNNLPLK